MYDVKLGINFIIFHIDTEFSQCQFLMHFYFIATALQWHVSTIYYILLAYLSILRGGAVFYLTVEALVSEMLSGAS